jgi:hypothetical protein
VNLTRSKVTVEMLRVEKGAPPRLLHRLTHSTHSLPAVVATMKTMLRATSAGSGANAFRITCDRGTDIYHGPAALS